MKLFKSKKAIAVAATAGLMLGVGGAAFAFFTATGNGTGSATVGTASDWTVGQTAAHNGPLYPDPSIGGANIQTNDYHVKNNSAGNQSLANVNIKVAKADGSAWTSQTDLSKPACSATDFSVGGEAVGGSHDDASLAGSFTAGQNVTTGTVTVEMIDNGANQDNCQGVTVPLYFFAS